MWNPPKWILCPTPQTAGGIASNHLTFKFSHLQNEGAGLGDLLVILLALRSEKDGWTSSCQASWLHTKRIPLTISIHLIHWWYTRIYIHTDLLNWWHIKCSYSLRGMLLKKTSLLHATPLPGLLPCLKFWTGSAHGKGCPHMWVALLSGLILSIKHLRWWIFGPNCLLGKVPVGWVEDEEEKRQYARSQALGKALHTHHVLRSPHNPLGKAHHDR